MLTCWSDGTAEHLQLRRTPAPGGAPRRPPRPCGCRRVAADTRRSPAVPPRPLHAARARGALAPVADRAPVGAGFAVRRDRRASADLDRDGHAGRAFEVTERSLVVPCANAPVDLLLVRPSDIPEYAQDGVVDLGITGANLVAEAGVEIETVAELGFARCTLDAAVPVDAPHGELGDLDGLRVATAYPLSTKRLLDERGVTCELVHVSGSVEATPRLGLADAIVDLVSTGSTMDANGLRPIGTLLSSQAVLVGGRAAIEERRDLVERLELMISGVVAARRRRYVMLNAQVDDLPAIRAVLPGMGA